MPKLPELVAKAKVIVVIGSGGVGKTTSSLTLALLAAQQGRRVGLLSIDPAKRLADALGIKLGNQLRPVRLEPPLSGSLDAAMLDQKAVFDEMVHRFAQTDKVRRKILDNPIYQAVSTKLGGPIEYMALAKLQQMVEQYEVVVLDTPPDSHALDFLMRPDVLGGFMDRQIINLMIKPFVLAKRFGADRLFGLSEKFLGGLAAITGIKMMQMLADFIVLMEGVITGFHDAGKKVSALLKEPTTEFILVSAPQGASVRSSENIIRQLTTHRFPLRGVVINRFPPAILEEGVAYARTHTHAAELTSLEQPFATVGRRLSVAQDFCQRLQSYAKDRCGADLPFYLIEEQAELIHSKEAILELAAIFENAKEL